MTPARITQHQMTESPRDYHWQWFTLDYSGLRLPPRKIGMSPRPLPFWVWPRAVAVVGARTVTQANIMAPLTDYQNKVPTPGEDLALTVIPRGKARGRQGRNGSPWRS